MSPSEPAGAIPISWHELLEAERAKAIVDRDTAELLIPQITSNSMPGRVYKTLIGFDTLLAHVSMVLGPNEILPLLKQIKPAIPLAIAFIPSKLNPTIRIGVLSLLSLLNVSASHGIHISFENAAAVDWTKQLAKQVRGDTAAPEVRTCAFASITLGQATLVPDIVGGGRLPSAFEPGQRFGFNTQGFLRYLARAAKGDVSYEGFEPAWTDFVAGFPRKLAAQTLQWQDLMWTARIICERLRRSPAEETAQWLHNALVSSKAAIDLSTPE